jgi:hypothetical protein
VAALCAYIQQQIAACKAKICACPLGQLISNGTKPINLFAGGLICPPCCPPINPDDLKQPSNGIAGACARFRKDTMEMKARVEAVRCLARADCHWWPEAETALIAALRTDRNECVRLEAARVLGSGCCCTPKTIESLAIVVSASSRDGNPTENSPRVRAAAFASLQHCVECYSEQLPEPQKPEKGLPPLAAAPAALGLQQVPGQPASMAVALADARRVLAEARPDPRGLPPLEPGQQSLFGVYQTSFTGASWPQPGPAASPEPPRLEYLSPLPPTGQRGLFQIFARSIPSQ